MRRIAAGFRWVQALRMLGASIETELHDACPECPADCRCGGRHTAARRPVRTGDFSGDGQPEGTVVDIFHSYIATFGLNLAEDGAVYLHISYDNAGTVREGLIRLTVDPAFGDGFEG